MLRNLKENNLDKCREIEIYLIDTYNNSETEEDAVDWRETAMLAFLRDDRYLLLHVAELNATDNGLKQGYARGSHSDFYHHELKTKMVSEKDNIQTRINGALIPKREKEFLTLFLEWLCGGGYASYQYNTKVEQFLMTIPENDPLAFFTKTHLYPKAQQKTWEEERKVAKKTARKLAYTTEVKPHGWGGGFTFGGGAAFLTQNLGGLYKPTASFNLGAELSYHNFMLLLAMNGGSPFFKEDFRFNDITYVKDSSSNFFSFNLSLGYNVFNHSYFRIIPFAGVAATSLTIKGGTGPENDESHELKVPSTFNPVVGVNFDFKFLKTLTYGYSVPDAEYWGFVRLQYKYHFLRFAKHHEEFKGGAHEILLCIGFGGNSCKPKLAKKH